MRSPTTSCGCSRIRRYTTCTSSLTEQERQSKALGLIPCPVANVLIAEVVAMLDAEAVVVQAKARGTWSAAAGWRCRETAQRHDDPRRPAPQNCGNRCVQSAARITPISSQSQPQVGNADAPEQAIVAPRLGGIRRRAAIAGESEGGIMVFHASLTSVQEPPALPEVSLYGAHDGMAREMAVPQPDGLLFQFRNRCARRYVQLKLLRLQRLIQCQLNHLERDVCTPPAAARFQSAKETARRCSPAGRSR